MGFLSLPAWTRAFVSLVALSHTLIPAVHAKEPETLRGTNGKGETNTLLVDRYPALYTGNFGDCMGGNSLINLTSFDAAYYADNMTVLFNMAGTTNLRNETVMCMFFPMSFFFMGVANPDVVYISVFACT